MTKHIHTITRGDRTYTLKVIDDGNDMYQFTADLDPDLEPEDPHMFVSGTLSEIVHAFAEWQTDVPAVLDEPIVAFENEETMQTICNPWYETSGRFPQTTVDAVKMYGTKNVADFISRSIIFLFDLKEV